MFIDFSMLGVFALSAVALTLIPGADMLCALSNAVSQGAKAGVVTVLGAVTGMICHISLAITGVTALIASSPLLYEIFVIGGTLYIMWVGFCIFSSKKGITLANNNDKKRLRKLYSQGFMTNLLNPKAIIFMLAFIPQFIRVEAGMPGMQMLLLSIELIIIIFLVEIPLVFLAGKIALSIKRSSTIGIYINRFFGSIILLFACAILATHLL